MMLVRYSGVKKHIPKGMVAKRDSRGKKCGFYLLCTTKVVQFIPQTAPFERGQIFPLIFYAELSLPLNRSSVH